jgi:hypothetical protein
MINNEYAYEVSYNFDLDYIRQMVQRNQFKHRPELAGHQRLVEDDPYLVSLRKQFPFLSKMYNIYTVYGKGTIPMHIDAARDCAFNIPISNTVDSDTIFYRLKDETLEVEYSENRIYNVVKSPVVEMYRFSLLTPTLINNSVPHEVINHSVATRVILSWSVNKQHDFESAKAMFKKITNE